MSETIIHEFAPAKVNLFLHILGRRPDGYHNLDSLVVFASFGDKLTLKKSSSYSLEITGPFATTLMAGAQEPNLVLQAADVVSHCVKNIPPGGDITLEKNIPISAGLGGGSCDAAAVVRALLKLHNERLSDIAAQQIALAIGADVSVCLRSQAAIMRGAGHSVTPLNTFQKVHAVLVNPRIQVSTADIFKALDLEKGAVTDRSEIDVPSAPLSCEALCDFLKTTENDLQKPALAAAPVIGTVIEVLAAKEGCLLSRMSGSGASCFGLFPSRELSCQAAEKLKRDYPNWWIEETVLS